MLTDTLREIKAAFLIRANGRALYAVGPEVGVSRDSLRRWLDGTGWLSIPVLLRIEAWAQGKEVPVGAEKKVRRTKAAH